MRNEIRSYSILAIVFVIFTVISFAVPFDKNIVFWLGYVSGAIAIVFQVLILQISLFRSGDLRSKFYGFPIARIGFIYLIIQTIASFVEMAIGKYIPFWPVLIINLIIIALAAVGCIVTDAVREEVERQNSVLKNDASRMRNLQSIASSLAGQCQDADLKKMLDKLADEFRYSDPVSSDLTVILEDDLLVQLNDIQKAIAYGDTDSAVKFCDNAGSILKERNRICALNK